MRPYLGKPSLTKLRWTVFPFQRILETFECITDHAFENIDNSSEWKQNALKIILNSLWIICTTF